MKELIPRTKIEIQKQEKQEYKFLGSMRFRKGLKLFGLDREWQVREIKIEDRKVYNSSTKQGKKRVELEHDFIKLVWALNLDNAIRKFKNFLEREYAKQLSDESN